MAIPPRRSPFGARLLGALVLALVALGAPVAVPSAAALSTGVTWAIDDTAKTITATIKITLTPVCSPNQRMVEAITGGRLCQVPQQAADDIKKAIEKVWNRDNKYYCYDIVVKVDITIDNSGRSDPTDRLRVQVDQSPVPVRSFVWGTRSGSATSGGAGSAPNDQLNAINNGTGSSTWGYPPRSTQTYAHEAGHVLGLDDGYEDVRDANGRVTGSRIRPGHADDMMSNNTVRSHLDRSTLRRMVERQGYRKTQLKCNYKLDHSGGGSQVTGLQCDPEGGLWTANGIYQVGGAVGDQTWSMTIDWTTKRGNFTYADYQEMTAVAGFTVKTEGTAAGRATLTIDDELNAHIHLVEQVHSYRSTIPGLPVWGADQNAPLISNDQVWEPIGKCPPP